MGGGGLTFNEKVHKLGGSLLMKMGRKKIFKSEFKSAPPSTYNLELDSTCVVFSALAII